MEYSVKYLHERMFWWAQHDFKLDFWQIVLLGMRAIKYVVLGLAKMGDK